jgi:peptidyl-prolyl cis-trans isomerase C
MNSTVAGLIRRFLPWVGLLTLVVGLHLAGCGKKAPTAESPTAVPTPVAAPAAPPAPPKPDQVVASVNGTNIMDSQVQQRIDVRYKPILAKLAEQSPQLAAQQEAMLRRNITNDLVTEVLLDEEVKQAGIQVSPEELTAEMTKQLAAQQPPMTVEQYQKVVEAQGGDFPAMKGFLLQNMKYHKLLESKFAGTLTVTEADAKKFYEENPAQFQTAEQVRASHILISTQATDPNADPNQVKLQAKQKAEALLQKVKSGEDFAALAKENSSCPSKEQGGDLGTFPRGQMVKPFEDAAFSLKVGEISNLVETQFGYHIIKVTEHQDPNQVPFEKAQGNITEQLTQQKRGEAVRKYIETLRQGAKITFAADAAPAPAPTPAPAVAPAPTQPIVVTPADANNQK